MSAVLSPQGVERLAELACGWTGFTRGAVRTPAIARIAAALLSSGRTEAQLLEAAAAGDAEVKRALLQVVSVGETYFFRHPEHFSVVASVLARREPSRPLRAWSAGCATGEETYSLAACLLAHATGPVEVLGTDLLERNLEVAREGRYGAWSVRESGPILYPALVREERQVRVTERVRAVVRFERHNLLEGPPGPEGHFDLVFCRNVLIYFSPEAALAASGAVSSALVPGGLAVFGPMDLLAPPRGLARFENQLTVFTRGEAPEQVPAPGAPPVLKRRARVRPPLPPAPAVESVAEPVAIHLRALVLIERGELRAARQLLERLSAQAPGYLPGLLERALLNRRVGETSAGAALMRELLRLTERVAADQVIAGPEPLPLSYYRASAELYLEGRQDEGS